MSPCSETAINNYYDNNNNNTVVMLLLSAILNGKPLMKGMAVGIWSLKLGYRGFRGSCNFQKARSYLNFFDLSNTAHAH